MSAPLMVVYDACVLYPAPLRDLLMHLPLTGLYQARWTDQIHEEWISALLIRRPDLTRRQLERTRDLMNEHALDALVTDYEHLIETIELPDPDDRHVLAAAVRAGAQVILTFNLDDFPHAATSRYGVLARHPDTFLEALLNASPEAVCEAVRRQRASLRRPPMTAEQLLNVLAAQGLSATVKRLTQYTDKL